MAALDFYKIFSGIGDSYQAGLDKYDKKQEDKNAGAAAAQWLDSVNNQPQGLASLGQNLQGGAQAQQSQQQPGGLASLGGNIGQAAKAIAGIESGGNYNSLGPVTKSGDRALGKYQVMAANIPQWSQEILGRPVTPQEFLANPQLQDQIFQGKFGQYVQKYGPEGAARAWFAGEGGMNNPNAKDQLGTSVSSYGQRFANAYGAGAGAPGGQPVPPQQMASAAPPQAMPQRAVPGGAMAYSAAGAPVPTDAQGRALNPNGMPTGPGQAPAQQAIAQAAPQQPPSPYGTLNDPAALPDWKGAPAPMSLASLGGAMPAAAPYAPRPALPAPPQAQFPQAAAPQQQPQQTAQAQPQQQPRFSPEESQALRAMLANPQTRAAGMAIIQSKAGVKIPKWVKLNDGTMFDENSGATRSIEGGSSYRPLTNPAERARYGIPDDDKKPYQLDPAGKLSAVGGNGTTVTIGQTAEKTYDTKVGGATGDYFVDTQKAGRDAQGQMNTLATMEKLIDSPDFYSGTGGGRVTALKRAMATLGLKDTETAAPNELFEKLSKQFVLDKAGGSLGANISNGDRDFIAGTVANIENTPAGNKAILQLSRRLAERQVTVAKMARDYAKANGGRIDGGFDDQMAKYAEANPITADLPRPAARAAPTSPAGGQRPASAGNPIDDARAAIAAGAPRDAVIKRLRENRIDPGGL